jgi:hypothetical protein
MDTPPERKVGMEVGCGSCLVVSKPVDGEYLPAVWKGRNSYTECNALNPPEAKLCGYASVPRFAKIEGGINISRRIPGMPIDPKALLKLWSLEEMPACDEGMELARSFLVSAGEAVSRVQNEDPEHLRMEVTYSTTPSFATPPNARSATRSSVRSIH